MYLYVQDFQQVLASHDGYAFGPWRDRFAQHADALARSFLNYPGTAAFTVAGVSAVLRNRGRISGNAQRLFQPWNGWWRGRWSNGVIYHHIWDDSFFHARQWVQLVSQSPRDFARGTNLTTMRQRGEADLAINVYGDQKGITGWVSKQGLEMPHVGYQLGAQKLLWIAKENPRGQRESEAGPYFMFFEWTDGSQYGIHGRTFTIARSGIQSNSQQHYGTYSRVPPERP